MRNKIIILSCLLLLSSRAGFSQDESGLRKPELLLDMIDTSKQMGKDLLSLQTRLGKLSFSGYMQPQFQYAAEKGTKTFNGGDFAEESQNRFMLRRARLKTMFSHHLSDGRPSAYIVFQFDGTERGVRTRDFWGRYYENKWELFSLSAGIMARPFGFEVQNSSSSRESPERGRMSQILMKSERDIGALLSFNPRKKDSKAKWLHIDLGLFNGQGLEGSGDFDSKKDLVGRIAAQSLKLSKSGIELNFGFSALIGGLAYPTDKRLIFEHVGQSVRLVTDAREGYFGKIAPRNYFGTDGQLIIPGRRFGAVLRAEYIFGHQTAYQFDSQTPGQYAVNQWGAVQPFITRPFDGAYFYYLQNIFSDKHQLVFKYDWYDPNKLVSKNQINPILDFTSADLRYDTWGAGYIYYINPYVKLVLYYEHPVNEKSELGGFKQDVRDDVMTCRLQFMF